MVDLNIDALSATQVDATIFGETITITKDRVTTNEDYYAWFGSNNSTNAVLVVDGTQVTGLISHDSKTFAIRGMDSGSLHALLDIDTSLLPPEYGYADDENQYDALSDRSGLSRQNQAAITLLENVYTGGRDYSDNKITIDVYIAHTTAAEDATGIHHNPSRAARLAIELANDSYNDNHLPLKLNLIDIAEVRGYVETTVSDSLDDITDLNNQLFNRVRQDAANNDADVIMFFIHNTESSCGQARDILADSASSAYAVVQYRCILGHTFTHELGHLQGAGHNIDFLDMFRNNVFVKGQPYTNSEFNYGHGWYDNAVGATTIMSYVHPINCPACERQGLWSDPFDHFIGSADPAGTEDMQWNAKVLFATGPTIASIRGGEESYDNRSPTASVSLSNQNPISGSTVDITATFDEEIHDKYLPKITLTNAENSDTFDMVKSTSTMFTKSVSTSNQMGVVNISISNARDVYGNIITPTTLSDNSYYVAVLDIISPDITAPDDITAEATGALTATSIGIATATDNVDSNPRITDNAPDSFPLGTTTVTWTATDSAGNHSTDTQTVIIQDTTTPVITIPDDITVEVTCPGTNVNLGQATATDSVDPNPVVTSDAPAQFPPGTITVTWSATDSSGNVATDVQLVTVRDIVNPVHGPLDNLVTESITSEEYANFAPSVTENSCDIITPTHNAPESFPLGDTIVTWTATDASGNSASVSHTVTIQDKAPPIVMAPQDITTEIVECSETVISLGTAATSDNYDPSPQVTNDAPESFPLGTTTVTWTATDTSGNMATDEQLVTIRDTTKPVLGPIDNLVSEPITVHDYANMAPSVTDNSCDVIIPTHDAPESFPLGDTIVTWTATDSAGNSASTTHTVTIHTAQLIIMAPLDVTAEVTCPGTTVSLGMAVTSDNDPNPEITNDAPDSFPLGTTTVTWTATDSAGTVATDTQQVTVRDTTAPGIRQVNDITQESTATLTQISLTAPGTVDNSCDVPTLTHDAPGSFPVGITVVTWTATDSSGNSAKAIQIITILGDGMPQPLQAYRIISNTLDDSDRSQDHSLVRLGDTFVLAHKNGGQGVIRSFDVSSDGRSITQLDALPHRSGLNEDMIQIGDNTLALVYAGNIDTLRVTDGDITPIKTHGIGSGYGPELVRLGHDTYALAYGYNSKSSDVSILRIPSHGNEVEHLDRVAHASTRTVNHNGVYMDSGIFVMAYSSLGGSNLVTFSVSPSNQISKLADMQYYPKKSFGTSVVAIDEDTVALGYTSLEGAYVKTYNVATNGTLSYVSQAKLIGSLSVDINIVHLSGQTHLAAYSDGGYGGWMRPLLIDNDGSISMGPAVMHDDQALYGSLVRADDDTAVFAYQGANSVSKIAILGVVTPEP